MNRVIAISDLEKRTDETIDIDKYPDKCPICHNKIAPKFVIAFLHGCEGSQIIYKCPSEKCNECFIANYRQNNTEAIYYLQNISPWKFDKETFRLTIKEVSPSFCDIYNEALESEKRGLTQICGAGYRKALEFLIKDYLINTKKVPKDIIAKTLLGECVNKYIKNEHINKCACRAAWLGNDETHYYRKWKTKDLQDLKTLIQLTANFIDSDLLTDKYEKEMPK
jgi:hypothetical protein